MKDAGDVVSTLGSVAGSAFEIGFDTMGKMIGKAASMAGKKKLGKKAEKACHYIGVFAGEGTKITANITGILLDATLNQGKKAAQAIGESVVKTETKYYGEADNFHDKDKLIEAEYNIIE